MSEVRANIRSRLAVTELDLKQTGARNRKAIEQGYVWQRFMRQFRREFDMLANQIAWMARGIRPWSPWRPTRYPTVPAKRW